MALAAYLTDTELLLHDFNLQFYGSPLSLTNLINKARLRIASESQCIRILIPKTSAFTVANQELYQFSTFNTFAQATAGVDKIQGILSIALNQGTITPVLGQRAFQEVQAYMRAYNTSYTSYPYYWAQYSFGANGSFYLWPVPSGVYGMDIDAYCLPLALTSDADTEAIPYPWTEAIPFYAAYWALMYAQRKEDANEMKKEYDMRIMEARAYSSGPFIPSMYGEDF